MPLLGSFLLIIVWQFEHCPDFLRVWVFAFIKGDVAVAHKSNGCGVERKRINLIEVATIPSQ